MIIDTTLFHKDFNALRIRLDELYDVVDIFVICESMYTFSGKPKRLYLTDNIEEFTKYSNKLKILINKKKFFTLNPWVRERRQRQLITKYLKKFNFNQNDLIIHSDCDEIPNHKVIQNLKQIKGSKNYLLELSNYHNYLNLQNGFWTRGRIVSGDIYRSINTMMQDVFLLQNLKSRRHHLPLVRVPSHISNRFFYLWKFPKVIFKAPNLTVLKNAGWHFNNLFPLEDIFEKVQASSHTDLVTPGLLDVIESRYKSGQEIYTNKKLDIVKIDSSFPHLVTKNLIDWKDFIFP